MSKWTVGRKTEATRFDRLQNLWEGCFKMKVNHCKNQGATRFDRLQSLWEGCFKMKADHWKIQGVTRFSFEKPIVKLKVKVEIEQHYKTLWRLADVID